MSEPLEITMSRGCIASMRSPSVVAKNLPEVLLDEPLQSLLHEWLVEHVGSAANRLAARLDGLQAPATTVNFAVILYPELLASSNLALLCEPQYEVSTKGTAKLRLPTTLRARNATIAFLRWIALLGNRIVEQQPVEPVVEKLHSILQALRKAAPSASNCFELMSAAYRLNIPSVDLLAVTQLYGQGRRSIWMDSTFTPFSSVSAANIARNKALANALLRDAGLPVPEQRLVKTLAQAKQAASKIGYPVVVKPLSLDGGVGVTPDVRKPEGVERAFSLATKYSKEVLLENHVYGKDYRLTIFRGRVLVAVERVPGGVLGDGEQSIEKLIAAANSDPRRGAARHLPLQPLTVNDEMRLVLAKQGLNLASVPEADRFVRLRHTANVNSGGMPVDATHEIHPDNAALAIRAAQVLRLDLAGVDLLIPEISVSWRHSKAAICEVNAQPSIGTIVSSHLYPVLISELVPGSGRIPVIAGVGVGSDEWRQQFAEYLAAKGLTLGFTSRVQTEIGGHPVALDFADDQLSLLCRSQALLRDTQVDVVYIEINKQQEIAEGLACDRLDIIVANDLQDNDLQQWFERLAPYSSNQSPTARFASSEAAAIVDRVLQLHELYASPIVL